jgi:transposase
MGSLEVQTSERQYPGTVVERMMKVQEVILRAMSGALLWFQAAEILGISVRSMQRMKQRYQEHGYDGLADRRRGRPSPQRVALQEVEEVLRLYRDQYSDLSVLHFHEKLREKHGKKWSYTWVKTVLQGSGLVARKKKRGPHRRRRERRPLPGMMLHIDGSRHQWFGDDRWYDLIVVMDDATSEVYYAQLVEEESTRTILQALREVIERQGVFCALYSDRGSHFFYTPLAGGKVDLTRLTQVGRAMRELRVEMIAAYSPQARGRSERNFGTWQGRLPQELRLRGIRTVEEANRFLRDEYLAEFNRKFMVSAAQKGTAFVPCRRKGLDWIFSLHHERTVNRDNTVRFQDQVLQIDKTQWRHSLAGMRVVIHELLDWAVVIRYGPHEVGRYQADGTSLVAVIQPRRGKGGTMGAWGNQKQVSPRSHSPLEISPKTLDSHFPTAPATVLSQNQKPKTKTLPKAA